MYTVFNPEGGNVLKETVLNPLLNYNERVSRTYCVLVYHPFTKLNGERCYYYTLSTNR